MSICGIHTIHTLNELYVPNPNPTSKKTKTRKRKLKLFSTQS
jgi:hypothetical protein